MMKKLEKIILNESTQVLVTQETIFGKKYNLGQKCKLFKVFGKNEGKDSFIKKIYPSGKLFLVDGCDIPFSPKSLHSVGSTITSGYYVIFDTLELNEQLINKKRLNTLENAIIDASFARSQMDNHTGSPLARIEMANRITKNIKIIRKFIEEFSKEFVFKQLGKNELEKLEKLNKSNYIF